VVWFDALMTNVDRTPRNPNLLCWHGAVWLIDHGAALFRQHAADDLAGEAIRPFPAIGEHVLMDEASSILEADERLAERVEPAAAAALIPDEWLASHPREAYADWLRARLAAPRAFAAEAEEARHGT
jgi:hypothetical protein